MTLFQTVTILIALTALGAYLNHRLLHLPPTIGLMAIALVSSLVLVVLGETGVVEVHRYARFVPSIDLSDLVFHGLLAFLLFAGALHVDLGCHHPFHAWHHHLHVCHRRLVLVCSLSAGI